jgi:hypothetical protein
MLMNSVRQLLRRDMVRWAVMLLLTLACGAWQPEAARGQWTTSTTNSNDIYNTNSGKVGVGTATPTAGVHVIESTTNGTAAKIVQTNTSASNGLIIQTQTNISGDTALYVSSNAGAIPGLIVRNNGNVGVGTTSPTNPLHVNSDSNPSVIRVSGNNSNVVGFAVGNTSTGSKGWSFQVAGGANYIGVPNGSFVMRQTTDDVNAMVISAEGRIGIGTGMPTAKLHVAGDIVVDGNIAAKYQDVAEWVPSTQHLAAGTVVVLDRQRTNHVLASTESYDTRVAGVISAQPGLLLGEGGAGKVKVATTGRVRVRVNAERGAIEVGDLLVTSDREGVAMKSEPLIISGRKMHSPGTLIGKALEPLASGTGEILVLLSLQ